MFKRLFSAFFGPKKESLLEPGPAQAEAEDHTLITVHDVYGRPLQITRSDWRNKVFLPSLKEKWNDADALYGLILAGLNDELGADLQPAANRLLEIDPVPERGHTMHGIVLMANNALDAAEATLREGMAKVGETGTLLTHLAKVQAGRGDEAGAERLLWQAIEADPNQDNGLLWWAAIQRDRSGEAGYLAALHKAAQLPGSWRAQLWLARHHLEQGEADAARALYSDVISGGRYDSGALMMISGDLGNNGQIPLILELVGPAFDETKHDPMAGLNLLRACQALERVAEGEALLSRLYALGHAPLKQHLDAFAQAFSELAGKTSPATPIDQETLKTTTLALHQPIWQYGLKKADWLFAQKPERAPQIGFFALGKRAEGPAQGDAQGEAQREDELGRLSRAIPLYLAEAVHYWTDYAATSLVIVVENVGPALTRGDADSEALFEIVPPTMKYFVTGKLGYEAEACSGTWTITLSLWNCAERRRELRKTERACQAELGAMILKLEEELLARVGLGRSHPLDAFYVSPPAALLPIYLAELGQSLMLTLLANRFVPKSAIWGERAMLDWPLNMALDSPEVAIPKLMYFSSLGKAHDYGSDVLPEYRERSLKLLKDAQTAGNPASQLAPLVWKIFGLQVELDAHRAALPEHTPAAYRAWLERVVA